jgi:MoaA/NifB/PqqE/SkfB family radical SAM enzyme
MVLERERGEGRSMAGMPFRDPTGLGAEAAELRLSIARALVRAPALPVELPAFGLTLFDVRADGKAIELVFGQGSPISSVRLSAEPARVAGELVPLGRAPAARSPIVAASIQESRVDAPRFRATLTLIAQRLRASITAEKWAAAMAAVKKLERLPTGVPLPFFRQIVPGVARVQGLVRTGFNCNQDCGLCWQGRDWGRFGSAQIVIWIEDLHQFGARHLIISGGEPTLDGQLERYVRHARSLGYETITLETNAIQLARPGEAARLRDAGLSGCFVSLHSADPETSDAITRAPGTHARTVKGIQALLAAGVTVSLNCVLTREGLPHLAALPDFVHSSFGAHPRMEGLMLSQPTDPFDRALLSQILPEPAALRAALHETIERAFALGVAVRGLDGPCGPPLCAFDADPRIATLEPVSEALDGRIHVAACETCAVRRACFGVRVADHEMFGEACARPLAAAPLSAPR